MKALICIRLGLLTTRTKDSSFLSCIRGGFQYLGNCGVQILVHVTIDDGVSNITVGNISELHALVGGSYLLSKIKWANK